MFRQGAQLKIQELVNVQFANPVLVIEAPVLALVVGAIHDALFDQETAPQVITVTGDQCVVEVEQCQAHAYSSRKKNRSQAYTKRLRRRLRGLPRAQGYGRMI